MKKILVLLVVACLSVPVFAFAQRIGGGDLTFNPPNAAPVFFSHEKHVSEKKFKCTACHYHLFQMESGSYKMNMSKINKGEFCGHCHNGTRSFDVHAEKNCARCHKKS